MSAVDPNDLARNELAEAMIPTPDDVMSDLSPLAGLFYLEQMGWAVLTSFTAYAEETQGKNKAADDDLAVTLNELAMLVGGLDQTCARIGLLPVEAVPPKWQTEHFTVKES